MEQGKYYEIPELQVAGLCVAVDQCSATLANCDGLFSVGPRLYEQAIELQVVKTEPSTEEIEL